MIPTRSPVVRLGVHVATPLALLVAAYLFVAGHNQPGGGFAAGLVLGAVAALRTVAGLLTPRRAVTVLAVGGMVIAASALLPLLWGSGILDQAVVEGEVPVLGKLKSGTALAFDGGVVLVVLGLVLAVLDGLGLDDLVESDASEPRS